MTQSLVAYLAATGRPVPPGCLRLGFSVATDAVGLEYTAVDWEAGPVDPPGGVAAAAGDLFYAEPDGDAVNPNYLWHEEVDLGLDPGQWRNGVSTDLADLPDDSVVAEGLADHRASISARTWLQSFTTFCKT